MCLHFVPVLDYLCVLLINRLLIVHLVSLIFLTFLCVFFSVVPLMDAFTHPEYLLLLLEQGERSLEDHARLFLLLANTTGYPDEALCSFYDASLIPASRVPSPKDASSSCLLGVDSGE